MKSDPFTDSPTCAKCGSNDINWCYKDGEDFDHLCGLGPERTHPRGEHFDMHCRRCHYEWPMSIKNDNDTKQKDNP